MARAKPRIFGFEGCGAEDPQFHTALSEMAQVFDAQYGKPRSRGADLLLDLIPRL